MQFQQLLSQINQATFGTDIAESTTCFGHLIQEAVTGEIFVDRSPTSFTSLDEAKDFIKQQKIREELQEEIHEQQYAKISSVKIANIIKQHHASIKVTDTLVESYVELASSGLFTTDPIANEIRNINKSARLIESHVDFKLDDGTVVVISEHLQHKLNNIFAGHSDVVNYIRSDKETFLSILNQIEG
jgi:hypothetical protein